MKRILFTLAFLLIAGAAIIQAQELVNGVGPKSDTQSWKRYTVAGEEFSVLLPALPAMTTTRAMRKRDHEFQVQRQIETSIDGLLYTIEVFENPKPKQTLDEFISDYTDDLKADLASKRNLTLDGYAGTEYLSADKDHPAKAQFFVTETRLYRFVVRGPGVDGKAATDFLASIRLGRNTDGIKVSDGLGDRIFSAKQADERVQLLEKPDPAYTEEARAKGTVGTVILKVVFTSKGTVENIHVIRGLPNGLTEKCIEAAKQIKFVPATKDGHPVSMWMQLEYAFWP